MKTYHFSRVYRQDAIRQRPESTNLHQGIHIPGFMSETLHIDSRLVIRLLVQFNQFALIISVIITVFKHIAQRERSLISSYNNERIHLVDYLQILNKIITSQPLIYSLIHSSLMTSYWGMSRKIWIFDYTVYQCKFETT